jgi:hypothetical protein
VNAAVRALARVKKRIHVTTITTITTETIKEAVAGSGNRDSAAKSINLWLKHAHC